MAIDPKDVKRLRDETGAGMMDCKRALEEAGGDFERAKEILREQGKTKAGKLAERAAEEGVVATAEGDGVAVLVEVNCATDFVAKTDRFADLARSIAEIIAGSGATDVEALLAAPAPGGSVADLLQSASAEVGEPVRVRRFAAFRPEDGFVEIYLHQPDRTLPPKIGVLLEVAVGKAADRARSRQAARDVALQVASMQPSYVSREEVPEGEIAKEREIIESQARQSGKPDNVIPKIVEGRLRDFWSQIVLLDQPYVRDDKQTVAKYLEGAAKEAGGSIAVRRFARFRVGGE